MKVSLQKYAKALCESLAKENDSKVASQKIQNLLKLLTKRKQSKLIKQLPAAFKNIWLKMHNKMEVTVILAENPSKEEIKDIEKLLSSAFNKEVLISTRINPEVIGGIKLEFDDSIIDNTVAAGLSKLKQHLTCDKVA
ncbi:ATP synthase F1 subunit delta [Candidatus Peregrinibacteria bacterium]|nr:ATP synthase F1 subunit delta [Candidatus Peregrinibacteria bacterium]